MIGSQEYNAFGKVAINEIPNSNSKMSFSTMPENRLVGHLDYIYRQYSYSLGRWITRDPIMESGGINLYNFVLNSPVNYIDFLGYITVRDSIKASVMRESKTFNEIWKVYPSGRRAFHALGTRNEVLKWGGGFSLHYARIDNLGITDPAGINYSYSNSRSDSPLPRSRWVPKGTRIDQIKISQSARRPSIRNCLQIWTANIIFEYKKEKSALYYETNFGPLGVSSHGALEFTLVPGPLGFTIGWQAPPAKPPKHHDVGFIHMHYRVAGDGQKYIRVGSVRNGRSREISRALMSQYSYMRYESVSKNISTDTITSNPLGETIDGIYKAYSK